MSDHDIQLLALGTTLGMYIMLIAQAVGSIIDDRRDRKVARAAQAELDASREKAAT
jgi:hypothetical protein